MKNKIAKWAFVVPGIIHPILAVVDWASRLDWVESRLRTWGVPMKPILEYLEGMPWFASWLISLIGGFLIAWFWRAEIEALGRRISARYGFPFAVGIDQAVRWEELEIEDTSVPPEQHPVRVVDGKTIRLSLCARRDVKDLRLRLLGSFPEMPGFNFPTNTWLFPLLLRGEKAEIPIVSAPDGWMQTASSFIRKETMVRKGV